MSPSPQLPPLSQSNRRWVFISMFTLFVVLVPSLVMYATGYRFNFADTGSNFRIVGGMYVSSDAENTNIFINDEPVQDMRIFQRAAYIQNLRAGIHEIYVEGDGLITWVKELPVFAQLVTEAQSFNLPIVPQVRVVSQYIDPNTGEGIIFEPISETPFANASSSTPIRVATTTATSTLTSNTEFTYVQSLLASTSAERRALDGRQQRDDLELFTFERSQPLSTGTSTATTTIIRSDRRAFEQNGEVYVSWVGDERSRPYYYCMQYMNATTTAQAYGEHVVEQLRTQLGTTTDLTDPALEGQRLCRDTIRIDRNEQEVVWFDFLPDNPDLMLMHLTNGLYVVEVDDRAWQNVQLLYPGTTLEVVIDGQQIFVSDSGYILEVFTERIAQ